MPSVRWVMLFNGCNWQTAILIVVLVTSLGSFHVSADNASQQQSGDARVIVRGRREAVNFWKRLQYPGARDKVMAFWKRAHPHDSFDSFWKRGLPADARVQAFWKRFMETRNDDDIASMLAEAGVPGGHVTDKKNIRVHRLEQQRRTKESARRPEFNPTGW